MKALTIWQPWASLIIAGAKPYEFRGWYAPKAIIGQRIAIHAGARPVRKSEVRLLLMQLRAGEAFKTALHADIALPLLERVYTAPGILPLSSVLGTAILGVPRSGADVAREFGRPVNDSDRDEHTNWAWPLGFVEVFEPFRPASGLQGFWNWSEAA